MSAIGNPIPGPRHGASKKGNRRQLLIYGGVAGALLLLLLIARRSSVADTAGPDTGQLTPVAAPASDGLGAGGIDNAAQLAGFESSLMDQLPQTISAAIAAGFASSPFTTGAAGLGALPGDPGVVPSGSGLGGQQVAAGTQAANGGKSPVKGIFHPAAASQKVLAPTITGTARLVRAPSSSAPALYVNTSHNQRAGQAFTVQTRRVGGKPHTVHVYANGRVVDMGPAR